MKNQSVMQHAFSRVPQINTPRSVFNRSHGYKTTFDAGYLVPIYADEVLPGDTVNLNCSILLRLLSPALKPFMDNLYMDTFWFFVPNRLLWSNFKKFMGEQLDPGDSTSFTVPQITSPNVAAGGIPVGHLFDYMGLPTGALNGGGATTGLTFNNLHGRAYNLTWNTYFRDQNLQDSVTTDLGDGPDTWADYNLLRRGKRHDYFTSALPFLQKGTAVSLPLGSTAPVISTGTAPTWQQGASNSLKLRTQAGVNPVIWNANPAGNGDAAFRVGSGSDDYTGLYADLSDATASTINTIRDAVALQQLLERDARGGTRYIELIKSHFGVTSDDARQQRPEILATYSSPVRITPIASTYYDGLTLGGTGSLGAYGTGSFVGHGFTKSFTEHGVLLGLISVRADLTYQRGAERMWNRRTRYDYYWPEFNGLGEQSILNREIYANLADGTGVNAKDGVFGYIPRYDEYRFKLSKITGLLNSHASGSLDVWHLSQEFSTQPELNADFIVDEPPLDRVIAFPSEPHFILDSFMGIKHARPMPTFGIPGLMKL